MGMEKQGDRGGEAGRWGWGGGGMGIVRQILRMLKKKQYLCGLIRWRVERETIWRRESETIQS